MTATLSELRAEYSRSALNKLAVDADPIRQFQRWLQEAIAAQLPEPNAMTLATIKEGAPAARVVLLKGVDEGFIFFTNYLSDKGRELAENPCAALVFLWLALERQVRIEGSIAKIASAESQAYFHSRPRGSQIGALASQQSQVVANRQILERRFEDLAQQYPETVPMPEHWGGYRLLPHTLEFWQGRQSRLHDRLRYRLQDDGNWLIERLEP